MDKHIKSALAISLTAIACTSWAQPPSQAELARASKANEFAKELMKGAAPAGKTLTGSLGFVRDEGNWYCQVSVDDASKATAVAKDPSSPERACVQAVLQLSHQKAI